MLVPQGHRQNVRGEARHLPCGSPQVRQVRLQERRRLLHPPLRRPGQLLCRQVADEEHGPSQREHRPVPPGQPGPVRLSHLERR